MRRRRESENHRSRGPGDTLTRDSAKQRFINEVQMTSSLTHPNTVAVFDFGQTQEGELYLVMELLKGEPLSSRAARHGPQPHSQAPSPVRPI